MDLLSVEVPQVVLLKANSGSLTLQMLREFSGAKMICVYSRHLL